MVRKRRPWTIFSSHGLVLVAVARQGNLTVPELAEKTGLSRSTILKVLKDLRRSRMMQVTRRGRRNTYSFHREATFRHAIARDILIGDFLDVFPPVAPP